MEHFSTETRTEWKSELKVCQLQSDRQIKNDKKYKLWTSKLNKDFSQIECFQCCLSIENSNSAFFAQNKRAVEN